MFKRVLILVLFICLSINLFAQPDSKQYQFRRIDISKGLSHNQVTSIFKDSRGYMWFGTMSGLNRYDGYKFKIFRHDAKDTLSVDDDFISKISELPDGKLLVETRNWINFYDPATEKFSHSVPSFLSGILASPTKNISIVKKNDNDYFFIIQQQLYEYTNATKRITKVAGLKNNIAGIAKEGQNNLWIVYNTGIIEKFDTKTNKVLFLSNELAKYQHGETFAYNILVDNDNELWIYALGDLRGIFYFKPSSNQIININKDNSKPQLNTNLVMGILQDNQSNIWICTDHGGINVLNKKNMSVQYVVNNTDDNNSLSQNSISSLYKDNSGIIWVGTYKKGINCFHENIIKFPLYRHQASNPFSLQYDDVNRFKEDAKGNIWIGTNGGGLIYFDRANGKFTQYRHQPNNNNSLSNDVIVSLWVDSNQKLWIGTYFGGLDCFDGKNFTHYQHNPSDNTTIADNRVWEIYEDAANNLWVGTLGEGLDRFDRQKNIFYHNNISTGNTIHSNYISAITEDKDGNLLIGTASGIDILEKKSGNSTHYDYRNNDPTGISNGNVMSIFVDSKNRIWVATRDGLNLFNSKNKTFQHFNIEDGLPDNTVLEIQEDKPNSLWVSTPNGISNIIISGNTLNNSVTISCKNYDESDGLQGIEFNENASLKTSKGELIFGGSNGFNIFQPQSIQTNSQAPQLVFTDFQLFNKSINPGEEINGKVLLHQAINQTQSITLKYNQNVIAIEFAALNFSNAEKNKYAYKLEGFKNEWLVADGKTRKAVFTNLDPGNYTFYVKTGNDNGTWNDNAIKLEIKILPPIWKTPFAYLFYFLVIATILYVGRIRIINKAKEKFAIEQERVEAQRMHELDLMKIKFFTNVSHEFRTPLSLILAPVDKMLKQSNEASQKQQLNLIHRNARRLLNLVNQLLDFRKMEERELKLHTKQGDIIQYISDISHFFTDVADKKNISFSFHSNIESLITNFDHDKIERILFNLLSNAFKFTFENGHVSVEVIAKEIDADIKLYELKINVQDTGIGIEADKQSKIFERFFQNDVPGTMVNQGSGIGLAITKEFVRLHGGSVHVESEPNKGSCFIVSLSVIRNFGTNTVTTKDAATEEILNTQTKFTNEQHLVTSQNTTNQNNKKPSVLLIEDNDDFRFYLKDNLKEYFNIIEAGNGKQGWQKALAAHPDLIVSDISMPEMDGIELCKKIKTDKRTTHIPVILLTALIGEEQQIKGLETGANDYMTKPFNFEILLSKIKNQLTQQQQLKKTYQKQVEVKPSDVVVESPTEKFMQQLLALVEKNISEPDFSVEDMSREMFMSRVALYKKLLALTGKTPIEFIREFRLKRAIQLFEKSSMTVAEVAYEVGFNNPKYFSKYFKAQYGKSPSVYIEELRKQPENTSPEFQKTNNG